MKRALSIFLIAFAVAYTYSAQAHSPHFTSIEIFSADSHEEISLRILLGDGIFFANPMRAVVVNQHGTLLAASPLSTALTLLCTSVDRQRKCVAYDELSRVVHEPKPELWRNAGAIEEGGRPLAYPEDMETEFGFVQRRATAAEIARAELTEIIRSWPMTVIAVAWWVLFWSLILPAAQRLFGRRRRPGLASITLRLVAAALMLVVTAYSWLLGPYSAFYFVFVSMTGAVVTWLSTTTRAIFASKSHSTGRF